MDNKERRERLSPMIILLNNTWYFKIFLLIDKTDARHHWYIRPFLIRNARLKIYIFLLFSKEQSEGREGVTREMLLNLLPLEVCVSLPQYLQVIEGE